MRTEERKVLQVMEGAAHWKSLDLYEAMRKRWPYSAWSIDRVRRCLRRLDYLGEVRCEGHLWRATHEIPPSKRFPAEFYPD